MEGTRRGSQTDPVEAERSETTIRETEQCGNGAERKRSDAETERC